MSANVPFVRCLGASASSSTPPVASRPVCSSSVPNSAPAAAPAPAIPLRTAAGGGVSKSTSATPSTVTLNMSRPRAMHWVKEKRKKGAPGTLTGMSSLMNQPNSEVANSGPMTRAMVCMPLMAPCSSPCSLGGVCLDSKPRMAGSAVMPTAANTRMTYSIHEWVASPKKKSAKMEHRMATAQEWKSRCRCLRSTSYACASTSSSDSARSSDSTGSGGGSLVTMMRSRMPLDSTATRPTTPRKMPSSVDDQSNLYLVYSDHTTFRFWASSKKNMTLAMYRMNLVRSSTWNTDSGLMRDSVNSARFSGASDSVSTTSTIAIPTSSTPAAMK
mmetsp:Transcript_24168/g.77590  ORF Transcript_24168/g.77590 Transcript_24168/m.77590 type:complete len:329 (-) Transcript_24168:616-1602(-)